MWKSKRIWVALLALTLSTCGIFYFSSSRFSDNEIRISSNQWVGFTPLIYAQEKGWLENTSFKFLWQVDLSENARLYERGLSNGFTATQYELIRFKNFQKIKPVFLIDKSAGADAILSNFSLEQLRQEKEPITVYLELGSLNEDFFHAFVKEHQLQHLAFTFNNTNQNAMSQIAVGQLPIIAISYMPYTTELSKRGFSVIASTKTLKSFAVIDALFVDESFIHGREDEYKALHAIFKRAKNQLIQDPNEYYKVVRKYLNGQSYDEFMLSTQQIEWVSPTNQDALMKQLNSQNIRTDMVFP